jgi:hypothetical protein
MSGWHESAGMCHINRLFPAQTTKAPLSQMNMFVLSVPSVALVPLHSSLFVSFVPTADFVLDAKINLLFGKQAKENYISVK